MFGDQPKKSLKMSLFHMNLWVTPQSCNPHQMAPIFGAPITNLWFSTNTLLILEVILFVT